MAQTAKKHPKSMTPFLTIWGGQALSLAGSHIAQFALVWWLTKLSGSATVLAMATLAAVLPQIVLGPIAGAYVDRWNRRLVMIVADGAVALAALGLVYLFWQGVAQIWHVYAIMLIRSIGGCFHWPAMQASTTLMVPEKHLTRVAGFNQTLQGLLNIVGPPLGAFLLALLPLHSILLIDVGTALFAIVPLLFISVPQPERAQATSEAATPGAGTKAQSVWVDVRQGLQYIWRWPGLVLVIFMAMLINFILTPAFSLMPLLVTQHFQGNALQLGWLEASWGSGVVLGGVLLGIWGGFKRRIDTSLMGLFLMGSGILALGLTPATMFWLAIGAMFITGFMTPIVNGPFFALLQATVAPEMQGRIFTVVISLSTAITPLSLLTAGPVADVVGVRSWYMLGGLICIVMGVVAYFVPAIRNIEQHSQRPISAEPSLHIPPLGAATRAE